MKFSHFLFQLHPLRFANLFKIFHIARAQLLSLIMVTFTLQKSTILGTLSDMHVMHAIKFLHRPLTKKNKETNNLHCLLLLYLIRLNKEHDINRFIRSIKSVSRARHIFLIRLLLEFKKYEACAGCLVKIDKVYDAISVAISINNLQVLRTIFNTLKSKPVYKHLWLLAVHGVIHNHIAGSNGAFLDELCSVMKETEPEPMMSVCVKMEYVNVFFGDGDSNRVLHDEVSSSYADVKNKIKKTKKKIKIKQQIIRNLKSKKTRITSNQCFLCNRIITHNSISFNCSHVFHFNCLKPLVRPLLNKKEIKIYKPIPDKKTLRILTTHCPICGTRATRFLTFSLIPDIDVRNYLNRMHSLPR